MKTNKAKIIFYDDAGKTLAPPQFRDVWWVDDPVEKMRGVNTKFELGGVNIEVCMPPEEIKKILKKTPK